MPLVAFILLAVVCLALLGFACACLTDPAQALDRATSLGAALPPLVEVWSLVFATLVGGSFLVLGHHRASGRASPAVLQRFLF
jgi:hypothetical protein